LEIETEIDRRKVEVTYAEAAGNSSTLDCSPVPTTHDMEVTTTSGIDIIVVAATTPEATIMIVSARLALVEDFNEISVASRTIGPSIVVS
jgi:hypothetical protein